MAVIEYALDENVAIVTMNNGENRFNFDFFEAFNKVLDEIENETKANVLVLKSADEKIFSNGIDLDWLMPAVQKGGPEVGKKFGLGLNSLFKRILTYPMITIAAINGHAFAGGAIMTCAFDFRFMRTQRGFFCFPEVDINIPFTPFLIALTKKAIPMYKNIEMKLTGKRLTAEECEEHHIIVKACHIDDLMSEVLAFAKGFNKDRKMLKAMKEGLYADAIQVFEEEYGK
ncbi:MAG: enoyl-CoA hydratase/isomerase family protein [Deltaproteobacteria bacterium]|nr:enoyl-CoA hydratase/isomerase family protein [Deltaproteobacteria bacterium]MBW2052825.1 enoyl-CoA hydratase/isomerase family protein [Deltaproteobacteria bacterium]MBW2140521.1 enoyl-CoA hydratase/isomerase family protein [Deltaproteobacteria bacterium]MBW2324303.1 enoyl-CoA hydratase/isomerase family protein [Deltaproteobacteria bacterium]